MVEAAWIERCSKPLKPRLKSLTCTAQATISTSASSEGVRPLQRQKQVLAVMKQHIPHPVHALDLKCAETAGDAFDPHGGGQGVHIRRIQRNKE